MTQDLPFRKVYTVTLDGSGNGFIRVSPTIGYWQIEQVSASTGTNTNEPEFLTYINGAFIGGSYSGSRTNDTTFNQRLAAQEEFRAVWVGGDAGTTATLVLTGKEFV